MISIWNDLFDLLDPEMLLPDTAADTHDINRRRLDELTRGAIWAAYVDRLGALRGVGVDTSPVDAAAPAHQLTSGFIGLVLDDGPDARPGGRVVVSRPEPGTWRERWLLDDKNGFVRADRMKLTYEKATDHATIGAEGVARIAAGIYPHELVLKTDGSFTIKLADKSALGETWRAKMEFGYDGLPSPSAIKAIDPPDAGAERITYRVRRQFAGSMPTEAGFMLREILPSASTLHAETVVDHWVLSADFKALANPGDVLIVDRVTGSKAPPADPEGFLLAAVSAGQKYYAQIAYTIQPT